MRLPPAQLDALANLLLDIAVPELRLDTLFEKAHGRGLLTEPQKRLRTR